MKRELSRIGLGLAGLAAVALLPGCQTAPMMGDAGEESTGQIGEVKQGSPADVFVRLASEYLREGNYQAALTNAKKAVSKDSRSVNAQTVLALVYESLGEIELAEKHYQRALRIDERDPYALNAYGSLLCSQAKYDQAISHFTRAVDNPLYETPWVALTNGAICARSNGDPAQAEGFLRRALEQNGRYAPALLQMARVNYDLGRYLRARAYLERYREVGQPTPESLWIGVMAERELGDLDQARSYEMLLRARFPDSRQVQELDNGS